MATTAEKVSDLEKKVEDIETEKTNIFHQQEQTISLLTDVLQNKIKSSTSPTYVTQEAPTKEKAAPNYALYAVGAAVLWFILKGK